MLGAAGALCCVAAGTAMGSWMHERRMARWRMLRAEMDALSGMRLLLEQERPAMPELLMQCAGYVSPGNGSQQVAGRLQRAAQALEKEAMLGVSGAYALACREIHIPWEREEERSAMEIFFRQLGGGTASMREQAAAACIRRLRPLEETAADAAEKGGRLCMQLGMLTGLMAGIILW